MTRQQGRQDDPRAVRTISALERALGEMLTVMPLGAVTVAELCRTAGVHRTTFYKHFATVGELAGRLARDVLGLEVPDVPAPGQAFQRSWLRALLALARAERPTLLGLIGPDGDADLTRAVSLEIVARTERDLDAAVARGARLPVAPPVAAHVLGRAYFGAVMAVLTSDPADTADLDDHAAAFLTELEKSFLVP